MKLYKNNDLEFKARVLFNGYPIVNEFSSGSLEFNEQNAMCQNSKMLLCDENYGRFFTNEFLNEVMFPYGLTNNMPYYNNGLTKYPEVVDELRVPYRRIPIFKVNNLSDIRNYTNEMKIKNPNHILLFRGQNKPYYIKRSDSEKYLLYGSINVKEPSFLASFSRPNQHMDYSTLCCIWHQLASLLINEINKDNFNVIPFLRDSENFHAFALGIAQHYGFPSVGLDFTDNLETSLWFALNKLIVKGDGSTSSKPIGTECKEATVYVFRCDKRTIFDYNFGLEKYTGNHRPLAQNAWFHHAGWGLSKNQVALQLMCGFRVEKEWEEYLPLNYFKLLFPRREDDFFLDFFIRMQQVFEYTVIGELLKKLYY